MCKQFGIQELASSLSHTAMRGVDKFIDILTVLVSQHGWITPSSHKHIHLILCHAYHSGSKPFGHKYLFIMSQNVIPSFHNYLTQMIHSK